MPIYDFIIIGLGTAGSATCMTLARRGFRVLGIDRHRPPHTMGSHHGASRSVRRAYLEGTAYVPMALKSWELWRKLERDSGRNLLVETGNLTIGPADSPAVAGFMGSAQTYDIPHALLDASDVRKKWPQLTLPDSFVAGLEKAAGIVFPELSIRTFLAEAEKAGADLSFDEPVNRWSEDHDHVHVHTARGAYETGRVLISAGAWTSGLLDLPENPLQPKRVPVHWITVPDDPRLHLGHFPVSFWQVPEGERLEASITHTEFYILPVIGPSPQMKIAFHNKLADCDPMTLDRTVVEDELDSIKHMIQRFLPDLQHCPMTSEVCMYTLTSDGHFYLGKRPGSQNVYTAALAGHGFKFAPVLGEILADLMTDVAPEVDTKLFSPDRFGRIKKT
jgi:sarcosine oxidase